MLVPFRSGVVTVKSSVFEGNKASSSGGAALIRNGDSVDWFNCTFVRNVAQSGGALLLTNGGGSRFDSSGRGQGACQFLENIAMDGGAVLCRGAGKNTLIQCILALMLFHYFGIENHWPTIWPNCSCCCHGLQVSL